MSNELSVPRTKIILKLNASWKVYVHIIAFALVVIMSLLLLDLINAWISFKEWWLKGKRTYLNEKNIIHVLLTWCMDLFCILFMIVR